MSKNTTRFLLTVSTETQKGIQALNISSKVSLIIWVMIQSASTLLSDLDAITLSASCLRSEKWISTRWQKMCGTGMRDVVHDIFWHLKKQAVLTLTALFHSQNTSKRNKFPSQLLSGCLFLTTVVQGFISVWHVKAVPCNATISWETLICFAKLLRQEHDFGFEFCQYYCSYFPMES